MDVEHGGVILDEVRPPTEARGVDLRRPLGMEAPSSGFGASWPSLTPVRLVAGDELNRAADGGRYVYFVESGLVSVAALLPEGRTIGVQLAAEGDVIGLEAVFLADAAPAAATVLVSGVAQRCAAAPLKRLCEREPSLTFRLAASLAKQNRALQTEIACCVHHGVEQRLARLLVGMSRRLRSDTLPVTQEQLASVLGVQRTTITALAGGLKAAGALAYLRGKVRILDPVRLMKAGCGCTP